MAFTVTIVDPNEITVNRDGITDLSGLTDTLFTSLASGDVIEYNGTNWVNKSTYIDGAVANTYSDGIKQTFNPDGTNAGINVGAHTAAPSSAADGDMYYNSTTNILYGRVNGAWVDLGQQAAGDAWSDAVDADIVPDTDSSRDLGATATRFAETYTDALDVTNNIVVGGTVDGRDIATDGTKLDGIETSADVTDATNVNAAGAVMESDYDANTILAANTDDTPAALTIDEQRVVGRITSGNIKGLTAAEIRTLINVEDGATAEVAATTSVAGISELATTAEIDTGTDTGRTVTPDALAGSYAATKTAVFYETDPTASLTTGNGKAYIHIPASYNGMNLVTVHAEVITAGTTGTTDFQIHNLTQAADMLSTVLTIDSGETGSDTAATPAVIDTANDDVSTNDVLRLDIDAVSTGTAPQGLIVTLEFRLP